MTEMSMPRPTLKKYPRTWGNLRSQRVKVHLPERVKVSLEEVRMFLAHEFMSFEAKSIMLKEQLEAIIICANYGDFLAQSLPHNKQLFDRIIVGTTNDDKETHEICRRFNVEILKADDATKNGEFNKGRLIARAQRLLSANSWRCHIDADIVLPTTFRHALGAADLQNDTIYGCDRVMVRNWAQWQGIIQTGYLQHQWDYHCRVKFPQGLDVGSRWADPTWGYCPIGFFQLWHGSEDEQQSFQCKAYPQHHGSASRTDTQHPLKWDRQKRQLLAEIIAVHLESEELPMGANWNGRTSKRFGPPNKSDDIVEMTVAPTKPGSNY